ncbi:hypothetical protein EDB19DRAFT_1834016 [Suillus lakei]|nr:hypothetical protein EDB19DRAFT_1834016 [Suillus lakei]
MQNEMEKVQEKLLTKRRPPFGPSQGLISMMEVDEADNLQEAVKNMEDEIAGAKKGKKATKRGEKLLIKDTIRNMQQKMSELLSKGEGDNANGVAHVPDGKNSWILDVKPRKSESISHTPSIATQAPPTTIFSQGTTSTAAISDAQVPIQKPVTETPHALIGSFADDINNNTLECDATIAQGKGKSKVASIFKDNLDFNKLKESSVEYESDDNFVTSVTEQEHVEDVSDDKGSLVSNWSMDLNDPAFEDPIMDFDDAPQPKPQPKPMTSVSVATPVTDSKPHAQKKLKVDLSVPPAHDTPAIKCQPNVNQRWTKKYLPTVILWAGSYEDIWTIPDEVLLLHAQLIFNVVYKELKITLVHGGVVHSLTAQHISEWWSNFGSTGIVIILDFLTQNSNCDPVKLAKSLLVDYAFLFEDPDKPSLLTTYCSPFVLQLLGTAHLNAINGYVEVPELNTHMFATCGMSHVIAVSAAAIEHALTMFVKNDLKVKQVLASTSKCKLNIKLLKVLNRTTRKMSNAPFLFSTAHWAKATASFNKSISSKPAGNKSKGMRTKSGGQNVGSEGILPSPRHGKAGPKLRVVRLRIIAREQVWKASDYVQKQGKVNGNE